MRAFVRCLQTVRVMLTGMAAATALLLAAIGAGGERDGPVAPELTHSAAAQWINSPPRSIAALRGKTVLIEFWTFDCIRSGPMRSKGS